MKVKSLKCSLILLLITFGAIESLGQDRFDIVTFTAPKGWQKEVSANAVQFGKEDAQGSVAIIMLFKALPTNADPNTNFKAAWKEIIQGMVTAGEPQLQPEAMENGWTINSGLAPYESDGKKGVAMLVTASGGGKMVNTLILVNSDAFQAEITKFVDSLKLPPVSVQQPPADTPAKAATGDAAKLIGRWQRSGSSSPSYADPASWGTAGYTKSRYEFKADGTYVYTERSFRYLYQNIIVVKENGRYAVEGNILTVTPAKSMISAYKKAGGVDALGAQVSSQNRKLETVAYKFTFHYFSGIDEWNLVLQADSPTQRDGQFSTLTVFNNAWYFDQKYTSTDLTAVRID